MKKELRSYYKKQRQAFSEEDIQRMSEAILLQVQSHFDLTDKNISLFLPIQKHKEINTFPFLETIKAHFYLPLVKGEDLEHILYESKDQLKISKWGIPEPAYGEPISANLLDVVFVPLLAFDQLGHRIGYGAGFYDRFLAQCSPHCQFIGLSFFEVHPELFETYPTDIPLDFCITPKKIYTFKSK